MSSKPKLLLAIEEDFYPTIFSPLDEKRLHGLVSLINPKPPKRADPAFLSAHMPEAEIVVTSWDTAVLDAAILDRAWRLRLVCHAAGTIRPVVSDALWERGVVVTSGSEAIAYGVAEFCLGLILTETKRVSWQATATRAGGWAQAAKEFGGAFEPYQQNIGIIGAGHIGRRLLQLLGNLTCQPHVYDPYLDADTIAQLGARKVDTLEELFATCRVVSLNAPTNESTREMLRGAHFAALRPGSLFINTAGSIQIHEEEFIAELRKGRFVACVDRCNIEPCPVDHPYRTLPNVLLTPHIAGVMAENRLRIGTFVVEEIERFVQGRPPRNGVTREALARMA
ncbi:MAG: putative oxidoreductase [Verrucomicrobia bacterium]|nr:putative oxidoreductase [Verrucomicrobiota bacterium]